MSRSPTYRFESPPILTKSLHPVEQTAGVKLQRLGDPLKSFERRDRPIVLDVREERDRDVGPDGERRERKPASARSCRTRWPRVRLPIA
jgi:hypothetical protein